MAVVVRVRAKCVTVVGFLLNAEAASAFIATDARAIERRVVRAEVAVAAVPERGHISGKVDRRGIQKVI